MKSEDLYQGVLRSKTSCRLRQNFLSDIRITTLSDLGGGLLYTIWSQSTPKFQYTVCPWFLLKQNNKLRLPNPALASEKQRSSFNSKKEFVLKIQKIILHYPIIPPQSFVDVFVFCCCCLCYARMPQYFHAEFLLLPASTAFISFLISMFLSFEVVSHQQVFR